MGTGKRTPNELKKLNGTYRADKDTSGNYPVPNKITYVDAPKMLNKYATQEWKRIVPELIELGVLTSLDLGAFTIGIIQYGIAMEAYVAIHNYVDENGKKKKGEKES